MLRIRRPFRLGKPFNRSSNLPAKRWVTGAAKLAFRDEEKLLAGLPNDALKHVYESYVKPAKARLDYEYMQNATPTSDFCVLWKSAASCLCPWVNPVAFSGEFLERSLSTRDLLAAPQCGKTKGQSMELDVANARKPKVLIWQVSLLVLVLVSIPVRAQQSSQAAHPAPDSSRVDIFAGYSDWFAHGSVNETPFLGSPIGATGSIAWYFNKSLGVQFEGKYTHAESTTSLMSTSIGPIMRFPEIHRLGTYVHFLGGAADIAGPNVPNYPGFNDGIHQEFATWGPQLTLGGGVDYSIPGFLNHLSWRALQADYLFDHVKFADNHTATLNSLSLSTGFVFQMGSSAPISSTPTLILACAATPQVVYSGEPVTLTGIATHLDPRKTVTYTWSYQGGVIPDSEPITTINTGILQPGEYDVIGRIKVDSQVGQSAMAKRTSL